MSATFAALIASLAAASGTAPAITEKNWREHPSIKEVRGIFQEVQELEKAGKLTLSERDGLKDCDIYEGDTSRAIRRDAAGKARKLTFEAGGDDSSITAEAYYDRQSKLRFIFAKAVAVNGTVGEYRLYFRPDGLKLWENFKLVTGPGYFSSSWPEESTPRDAEARFASSFKCYQGGHAE